MTSSPIHHALPVSSSPPPIDLEIGMATYSTRFPGTKRGRIRTSPDDFEVSEVISQKVLDSISMPKSDIVGGVTTTNEDSPAVTDSQYTIGAKGYPVYILKKRGIDTTHAVSAILKKTGMRLRPLGLKDAAAVTKQYACSVTKGVSLLHADTKKCSVTLLGYVQRPLSKRDMIGNRFKIKIVLNHLEDKAAASTDNIKDNTDSSSILTPGSFDEYGNILNFYGYQRFGSKRPVTHLIGKAIVKGDYEEAINLILSFESPYDTAERNQVRRMLGESLVKRGTSQMVSEQNLPRGMDIERRVLAEMNNSNDPVLAFRTVPLQMRRFYVNAYQSYIFNMSLSDAYSEGEDLGTPTLGDVCFDQKGTIIRYEGSSKPIKNNEKTSDVIVALPLVGYAYYARTRFDRYVTAVLAKEGVTPADFVVRHMPEIGTEGGFRGCLVRCTDCLYDDTTGVIEFVLSRGSFATVVLREIIKSNDPLNIGF